MSKLPQASGDIFSDDHTRAFLEASFEGEETQAGRDIPIANVYKMFKKLALRRL